MQQLIKLCICTGKVDNKLAWIDIKKGVPQGAVLSPLLANLYLHELDLWATRQSTPYIRYADDFIILAKSEKQTLHFQHQIKDLLNHRLHLAVNENVTIKPIEKGFEFLGILVTDKALDISETKKERLHFKINKSFERCQIQNLFNLNKTTQGITNFYGKLLEESKLHFLDEAILELLKTMLSKSSKNEKPAELFKHLNKIQFITHSFILEKKQKLQNVLLELKIIDKTPQLEASQLIERKKRSYQKMEAEGMELMITTPGTFIGKSQSGLRIRTGNKYIQGRELAALKHITIISRGISISTDAIQFCTQKDIGIDLFDEKGQHLSAIFNHKKANADLWQLQLESVHSAKGKYLAIKIVEI